MPSKQRKPESGKARRVVKRSKRIPKLDELYRMAHDRGMTVQELVEYLNSMNADKTGRRNKSTTYDMGPIPYRGDD